MTVNDLIAQVSSYAGDDSGDYVTDALRWLNLCRSDIATEARWRSAMATSTFDTAAATTTGLYSLTGYESLIDDWLFDTTNNAVIQHESYAILEGVDVPKTTTGQPSWWADAGVDGSDERQIYLWPIPSATFTIRFHGYKTLSDIEDSQGTIAVDPFYGTITPWASTFVAGMRYYHDLDTNEEAQQIAMQYGMFQRRIKKMLQVNRIAPNASLRLENVRRRGRITLGRLDPSRFSN